MSAQPMLPPMINSSPLATANMSSPSGELASSANANKSPMIRIQSPPKRSMSPTHMKMGSPISPSTLDINMKSPSVTKASPYPPLNKPMSMGSPMSHMEVSPSPSFEDTIEGMNLVYYNYNYDLDPAPFST